jgi:UPF0176 protein
MFCRLVQSASRRQFFRSATIIEQKFVPSHLFTKSLIPTMSDTIPSTKSFSTTTPKERGFQPVSKIENYDSSTYKTLAFYKFHEFTKPELEAFRTQLLNDFGELGIVGRIYISTEGVNAQIACPEECLDKLQHYHNTVLKPMFDGNLMNLNIGTEHGKRSFRALHVRIRKQVTY